METRRLYWEDPFARNFIATIEGLSVRGDAAAIFLDRTLFHPEGGGQPSDRGRLVIEDANLAAKLGKEELLVSKAVEEAGAIAHLVDPACLDPARVADLPALPQGGWPVRGAIDWPWRFDLMQQHTGQHILSRAFQEALGAETVGFHLAAEYATIDLSAESLRPEDTLRVEELANQVVFDDVPVTVREYDRNALPPGLRSRFDISSSRVRVVHVGEFDACPCGGTHVVSSGQIGIIKVNQTDRAHGGVRVVFRCGGRALLDYRRKEVLLDDVASALSQPLDAVPETARELVEKLRNLQDRYDEAQQALLDLEVERLLSSGGEGGESLVAVFAGMSAEQLKYAAKKLCEGSGRLAVCLTNEPRFAATVASPPGGPDARSVVQAISSDLGGRGGGTKELAQLGSKGPIQLSGADIEDRVRAACRRFEPGRANL